MANDDYQAAILKIVNEVDQLVTYNPAIREVFTRHIDQLCKLVEDYGQAQQPYSIKLEKAKKRIEKFTPKQSEKYKLPDGSVSLVDICPPPKGYVKMNHWDNRCINIPENTIYRPAKSVNPLNWFGIIGCVDISTQRKPTEDEKLMCDYVRIGLIHDRKLSEHTDSPIFSADYNGKWFKWDKFREVVWGYYKLYLIRGISYTPATPEEKISQLNRALGHVKADIENGYDSTEEDKTISSKSVGADLANANKKLSDIVPELAVYDIVKKQLSYALLFSKAKCIARYSAEKNFSRSIKTNIKSLFSVECASATRSMRDYLLGVPDLSRDEQNYRQRQFEELYDKIKDLLIESLDNNVPNLDKFNELEREEIKIKQGLDFDAGTYLTQGFVDKTTGYVKYSKPAKIRQETGGGSEVDNEEYSFPLFMSDWARIFGVSRNKIRELREDEQYHFRRVSDRKWSLPKKELPAEYLEKYRNHPTSKSPQKQ